MAPQIQIDIWSDIACPYCYIGKRKLAIAISDIGLNDTIKFKWHAYELNPVIPKIYNGQLFIDYFSEHYNISKHQAKTIFDNIEFLGKEVGIDFNFDKVKPANTHNALRLIKFADQYNLAHTAQEFLFEAYFTKGLDISNHEILIKIGRDIGLSDSSINDLLSTTNFDEDIKSDIEISETKYNLEYIPFYRLNNKISIQGSLTIEEYKKTLKNVENDISSDSITYGKSCSIDGVCE